MTVPIELSHELMLMADGLSKYGVAPRYPNEIDVDEYQAARALQDGARIIEWVKMVMDVETVENP